MSERLELKSDSRDPNLARLMEWARGVQDRLDEDGVVVAEIIADGRLSSATSPMFSVSTGYKAIVKHIKLNNRGAGSNTATVYLKRKDGTSRVVGAPVLLTLESADILEAEEAWTLRVGDLIEGFATNNNEVDYTVLGEVRPA